MRLSTPKNRMAHALGDRRVCFDGDPMQAGVGTCRLGFQDCVADGEFARWAPCEDQSLPAGAEICSDGLDNDCNGMIDDDCTSASYGPWAEWGVCEGPCEGGTQTRSRACAEDGEDVDCAVCGGACTEEQACTRACTPTCMVTAGGFTCDVPGEYEVVVPAGVTGVDLQAWAGGGAGGASGGMQGRGGGAGFISAFWSVMGGRVLRVEVAEGGLVPSGGGGASRVRDP